MLNIKECLTNEALKGHFKNNFELANYAIQLGRYFIRAGHEVSLGQLLDQIKKNPSDSFLKELQMLEEEDESKST